MRRPGVAYPLAFLLVFVGMLVAIRWSVPGTVNGATIVLVLSIVGALTLVAKADRGDEAPTSDERYDG